MESRRNKGKMDELELQNFEEEVVVEQQEFQEVVLGYIAILWRRKIWVFIPLLMGTLISGFLIYHLPNIYRSSTLILVEAQQVPQDFVKSAVSGSIEGRLSTIKQQILSRTNLQKLIDKYRLYQNIDSMPLQNLRTIASPLSSEETIDLMRNNISIETIGEKKSRVDAFTISFDGRAPELVMNVTNELASLFIEENLKIREQLVEGTTVFLENELKTLKSVLENQEKQIGDFKRRFIGELPEQLDANLRALDRYQTDLLAIKYAKSATADRITSLENTLEESGQMTGDTSRSGSFGQPRSRLSIIERKLSEAENKLTEIRLQYTEGYPDAQILILEIKNLKEQLLKQLPEDGGQNQSTEIPVAPGTSRIGIEEPIRKAKVELERLEEQEERLRNQIRIYEQRVENVPTREQELAILVRDYNNTQSSYQVLLDKKLNAQISENLEKRQKGERFRVIDPANLPGKPVSPNRLKIGFLGLFAGLGGGIALAFLRDQFNKFIQSPEEIEKMAPFPVLENIPDFTEEMMKDGQ